MPAPQLKLVPKAPKQQALFEIDQWIVDDPLVFDAWNAWVEMRIKIKKPMTDRAKSRAMDKLWKLKQAGHSPLLVLFQSEDKNYTDLYPPSAAYLEWL